MRPTTIYAVAVLAAMVGSYVALAPPADASNAIAEETQLVCTTCHDKPGSKLLTDEGKYFEAMATLDGFDEVSEVFGACTSCHARKPGSRRLTANGKQFRRLMQDMEGIRQYAVAHHQWWEDVEIEMVAPGGMEEMEEPVTPEEAEEPEASEEPGEMKEAVEEPMRPEEPRPEPPER